MSDKSNDNYNLPYDAEIYGYQKYSGSITGKIHNDKSGRWENGTTIVTSTVQDWVRNENGTVIGAQTRNTLYRIFRAPYTEEKKKEVGLKTNVGCILK